MSRVNQLSPVLIIGNMADLPAPPEVQGYIFHAIDTGFAFVSVIDPSTGTAAWSPLEIVVATQIAYVDTPPLLYANTVQSAIDALKNGTSLGPYNCNASISVGELVYISSPNTVSLADASSAATMPAIGTVISKPLSTIAIVSPIAHFGSYSGLVPGNVYYVSTIPGGITNVPPSAVGQIIQKVGIAENATTLSSNVSPFIIVN